MAADGGIRTHAWLGILRFQVRRENIWSRRFSYFRINKNGVIVVKLPVISLLQWQHYTGETLELRGPGYSCSISDSIRWSTCKWLWFFMAVLKAVISQSNKAPTKRALPVFRLTLIFCADLRMYELKGSKSNSLFKEKEYETYSTRNFRRKFTIGLSLPVYIFP